MLRRNSCILTLLQVLTLATLVLISQKSSAELAQSLGTNRLEWVAPTATANGRVRVIITKTKAKLHLPKRPLARVLLNDNEDDYYDETPEFQVGYRRPELIDQTADVQDISDEMKIRLILARKKALAKYEEVWG
jgi:hypothetical protein